MRKKQLFEQKNSREIQVPMHERPMWMIKLPEPLRKSEIFGEVSLFATNKFARNIN